MKLAILCTTVFMVAAAQPSLEEASQMAGGPEKIIVRFLDGKNGKPIKHDFPNIWLGDARSPRNPYVVRGEVVVEIGGAQPREIRVLPNNYVDCRFKADSPQGGYVKYSIDEVLSRGVVGDNFCGQAHAAPKPGVLLLYVRPRTPREKREL